MPSANKDRVTISLHLDKRIYSLLKRCSEFEKQPMSRIVDQVLEPYVIKYQYDTLEEMEIGEDHRLRDLAEEEEIERMTYEPPADSHLASIAEMLSSLEGKQDAPIRAIEEMREYYTMKLSESEKERIQQIQEERLSESERWKKAVAKYPLP
jgi:hypothetical protein